MSQSHVVTTSFPKAFDWETKKRSLFSALFFCAFMSLCVRGLYEVTIGKVLAYGAQVGFWSLLLFSSVTVFRYRTTNLLSIGIVLTFLFGISAMISSILTLDVASNSGGLIAALVNVYLLLLFVAGYGFQSDAFAAKPIVISMAVAGVLLPVFGILQLAQIPIFELPGRSLLRPPSLTGSFLHFPLICGLLTMFLLEAAKALRWRFLYAISLLCMLGVVISGGRSGTVVIVGAGALYVLFEFDKRPAATKLKFGIYALSTVLILTVIFVAAYQYVPTLQRISRLWDLQEGGNNLRVRIWGAIFAYWRNTNLWFGEFTGMVGNTNSNINGNDSISEVSGGGLVAESGALQQLINFGALGLLSFYGVMLLTYRAIEKECTFLRALFVAAMVQTLFYQSTEVLPYMAMLAFMPFFSRSLLIAGGARYSNHGR